MGQQPDLLRKIFPAKVPAIRLENAVAVRSRRGLSLLLRFVEPVKSRQIIPFQADAPVVQHPHPVLGLCVLPIFGQRPDDFYLIFKIFLLNAEINHLLQAGNGRGPRLLFPENPL